MSNRAKSGLRNLAWYFLVWTVVGLFFFTQDMARKLISGEPTPWWHYLTSWIVGVYLWALWTPVILWLGGRLPIERRNWIRRTLLHLMIGVGVSLAQLAVESVILSRLGVFPTLMKGFLATFVFLTVIGFHQGVLTYLTVLGIQAGFRYYRQYQEREQQALRLELNTSELKTQLVNAQLNALKMQLQPHFLFNTLNAIMVLVRQQKGRQAEEMLARLGDLLRCVLEDVEAQEVTLRRELEYLRLYLSIEEVRFADRLRVEISADPAILDAAVPQMGLQPIVENAIRHGLGKSSAAGRIHIAAARVDDTMEIKVADDGPGLPEDAAPAGTGIGLANTRARLRQLYGDAAKLTMENGAQGGAVVTMKLPYRIAPELSGKEVMEIHALHDADR
ncbi:MAG TPA: histidine kinase [Candidatus Solibacter sp.]|nr:histidine kinase [Candidatus Solibacter sp.]